MNNYKLSNCIILKTLTHSQFDCAWAILIVKQRRERGEEIRNVHLNVAKNVEMDFYVI